MEEGYDDHDFDQYLLAKTKRRQLHNRRRKRVFASPVLIKVCKKTAVAEITVTDSATNLLWQFLKIRKESMSNEQVDEALKQIKSEKAEQARKDHADYLYKFKQPSTIIPDQLYLGPALDPQELKNYTLQHEIKNIISITGKPKQFNYANLGFQEVEYDQNLLITPAEDPNLKKLMKNFKPHGQNHLKLDCQDTEISQISKFFEISYQFIDACLAQKEKVYIHCQQGISRSATLLAYYLLRNMNKSEYDNCKITDVDSCLEFIRSKRPLVNPNRGFVKTLEKLFNGDSEDSGVNTTH